MKSRSSLYTSSMLWKPIVYQSVERTTEQNTLMQIYSLKNNASLQSQDQGIFRALYQQPYVSAFSVSLGRSKDSEKYFFSSYINIISEYLRILCEYKLFLRSIYCWFG